MQEYFTLVTLITLLNYYKDEDSLTPGQFVMIIDNLYHLYIDSSKNQAKFKDLFFNFFISVDYIMGESDGVVDADIRLKILGEIKKQLPVLINFKNINPEFEEIKLNMY